MADACQRAAWQARGGWADLNESRLALSVWGDMTWKFDQAPNVACIASRAIFEGEPVLTVSHFEDDHSWAFLDGSEFNPSQAYLVAMSEVLDAHPDLVEIVDLPPGWTASRAVSDKPWSRQLDD